jgi:hypothetical protein
MKGQQFSLFSQSGMKWSKEGVDDILLARALILTDGQWNQFWNKIDRFGYYNQN